MSMRVAVYVAASETGILYIVLVRFSKEFVATCQDFLDSFASLVLRWAHEEPYEIPSFVSASLWSLVESRFSFWNVINTHVKDNGTFPPLKAVQTCDTNALQQN